MTALVIIWVVLGFVTAKIAESKGRPFGTWLIYGFLCFPLAILYLAVSKPSDETLVNSGEYRKCPFCAEVVRSEAKVCRYCNKELPDVVVEEYAPDDNDSLMNKTETFFKIIGVIIVVIVVVSLIS